MANTHLVTAVISPTVTGEEIKLSAHFTDDQSMITIELENVEIFIMDYDNFVEWSDLIKKQTETLTNK